MTYYSQHIKVQNKQVILRAVRKKASTTQANTSDFNKDPKTGEGLNDIFQK